MLLLSFLCDHHFLPSLRYSLFFFKFLLLTWMLQLCPLLYSVNSSSPTYMPLTSIVLLPPLFSCTALYFFNLTKFFYCVDGAKIKDTTTTSSKQLVSLLQLQGGAGPLQVLVFELSSLALCFLMMTPILFMQLQLILTMFLLIIP